MPPEDAQFAFLIGTKASRDNIERANVDARHRYAGSSQ